MFLAVIIIAAISFSMIVNTSIKSWVYEHIIDPELEEVEKGKESGPLMISALGLILLNNLIPFTLGTMIGLYVIM
jgi:hypothetical protein